MGCAESVVVNGIKLLTEPLKNLTGEVRYKHLRLRFWSPELGDHNYNKGGVTLAYRYLAPGEIIPVLGGDGMEPAIVVGFAGCSWADNFDRKLGRKISAKRLEKSQVVIVGEQNIKRLMTALDPLQVADFLADAMAAQGLRLGLCA